MQASHVLTRFAHPHLVLACFLMAMAGPSHAKDYLIEVLVIENIGGKSTASGGLYIPKAGRSLTLGSDAAKSAGFEVISEELSLADNAESIRKSGRFRLLKHLAWRQPGLSRKEAKSIRVSLGGVNTVYVPDDTKPYDSFIPVSLSPQPDRTRAIKTLTVSGTIKVRLGRFLHMDTLLVYTDAETGASYRLKQSRKMRSRELHYIDNPRFGLLTRILPIEESEEIEVAPSVEEPIEEIEEPVSGSQEAPATGAESS